MTKILFVYDAVYPYSKGGAEKRYHELGKELVKAGCEVHLYGMKYWDGPATIEHDGLVLHGLCRARPLYNSQGRRTIGQALVFGVSCLRLIRVHFDYIDCCGFPFFSVFVCKLVCVLRRKPLHATWHEVWGRAYWRTYLGGLGLLGYWVERLAAAMPDSFIAVSEDTMEEMRSVYRTRKPIAVIENGLDLERISRIQPSSETTDILYVGRLVAFKHVDVLLRALTVMKKASPQICLTVIGEGPERSSLEQLAGALGLQDNVTFVGTFSEHDEVIARMKSAGVLALPSTREGFGLVVIEAIASGTPVVTIDHPSNAARRLITNENGRLSTLDPTDLAGKLTEAMHLPRDPQAYRRTVQQFSWPVMAERLERLLVER